jgi:hypothetical protein
MSVLGPLLFLAYVNDIWRIIDSSVRLFADDCIIYKVIINIENIENSQKSLYRLGEWAAENAMKIKESNYKAVCFTSPWVKGPLNYTLRHQ